MFSLFSVVLFGLDGALVSFEALQWVCKVRLYFEKAQVSSKYYQLTRPPCIAVNSPPDESETVRGRVTFLRLAMKSAKRSRLQKSDLEKSTYRK